MKILLISDIHGSLFYAKKAMEAFEKENAQFIAVLGDELYHGARNPLPVDYNPKGVAELLNGYSDKIIAVRGNCDSEVDEMVLDYPIMSTYSTILYGTRRIFLTHGHIYNESNLPKLLKGDVFIYGHTHIPKADCINGIYVVNPGSVSMPKEGNPNSYGIISENSVTIKDFEGNQIKNIDFI
ncbi:MAG TPA: phosphodiesterase [Pseudobacteroides sp.]|mgnify:CR=1 FL=1|nr:phosphodiesterase [Pseudobacteroides sp.]